MGSSRRNAESEGGEMNIKELAEQAGLLYMDYIRVDSMKQIEHFAKLVAAHEREECAKLCDERVSELYASRDTVDCAEYLAGQIRARGNT